MAYSYQAESIGMKRRFLAVVVILFLLLTFYTIFVYTQWQKYNDHLKDKYITTTKVLLESVESHMLRDISVFASVVYGDKNAAASIKDVGYIAYDNGQLWSTNLDGISKYSAMVIYPKIKRYMDDEPVKVIPRMYLTYYGMVVGFVPSWDKNKLIVVVFPARYLESSVYRILSSTINTDKVNVMLFTAEGMPIALGEVFDMSAFLVKKDDENVLVSGNRAISYARGRFLSMALVFDEQVFPFGHFVLRYYIFFALVAYILYGIYHFLEYRYFLPLDDLQHVYTTYVRSQMLDRTIITKHRRRSYSYLYPANIIYVLLDNLAYELDKFAGVETTLSGIYSLFSRLGGEFDENDTTYLNKIMDSVRDVLDVDAVFMMVKEGDAYRIKAYAGVVPLGGTATGMRVYSNYWDKYFRGMTGTYVEEIKKGANVKDTIMTGVNFISTFDRAIISTLGFGDMIEGLLVVLIRDERSKDIRLLEDLVSIVSYMLTVRIMLSRLKASSDEIVLNSLLALLSALEVKDPYTAGHSSRVALYGKLLAEKLNLSSEDIDKVYKAALLHDMGKEGVPDRVLLKPAPLSDDEWEYMKKHPIISASIIEKLGRFTDLIPGILHHHTRYDGMGYPGGLKGKDLPLIARIIAVVDAYDAMTTDRPYRHALPEDVAINELIKGKGKQFDPDIVDAFIELYKDGKVAEVKEQVPSPLSFRSPEIMEKVFRTLNKYMFMIVDVNGMFYINTKYGKHIGDKILDIAESMLKEAYGSRADVGRLDGDHIAVLFDKDYPSKEEIERLLAKLRSKIHDVIPLNRDIFKIAVLRYPEDFTDRRSILHYANVLLLLAKTMGRPIVFMEDIKRLLRGD
ncbi:HD domain-containing protein [bacterium 3DAC]|nr:HD domain-containing protein [bacterium 3DAC]